MSGDGTEMVACNSGSIATKLILLVFILSFICGLSLAHGEETIAVDKTFNGREIKVRVGSMIRVELEQAGAAGYTWEIHNLDSKHFEVASVKTPEPTEKSDLVGAPVKKTWLIRAIEKGKSELRFIHFRPWEGKEKAADLFVLKVRII
jgi:predicted secreted protein